MVCPIAVGRGPFGAELESKAAASTWATQKQRLVIEHSTLVAHLCGGMP